MLIIYWLRLLRFLFQSDHSHEKRVALLIFSLKLEISEIAVQKIHQTARIGGFCEKLHSENDCEAVWATFCCYDFGAKVSKTVQKIATDEKDYHKCSSCVVICWIAKIYQSITVKKGWLFTYEDTSGVAIKAAEVAQKRKQ